MAQERKKVAEIREIEKAIQQKWTQARIFEEDAPR